MDADNPAQGVKIARRNTIGSLESQVPSGLMSEKIVDKEIKRGENNHNRLECLGHMPWPMPSFAARRCYHRLPCMKMEAPQGVWHLLFFRDAH